MAALGPWAALAHERRAIGDYSFLVGFNAEPAIQGQMNGAQLTVTMPGEDNRPVVGLQDTLQMWVSYGDNAPKTFPLAAVGSTPGRYVAQFIPTESGTYTFMFTGTVEGLPVNEQFVSGPGRFSDVDPAASLQYP
jgi:hypothetical protein